MSFVTLNFHPSTCVESINHPRILRDVIPSRKGVRLSFMFGISMVRVSRVGWCSVVWDGEELLVGLVGWWGKGIFLLLRRFVCCLSPTYEPTELLISMGQCERLS
jgi:hypothetical protein